MSAARSGLALALLCASASPLLSGCAAVAVPAIAASAMGGKQVLGGKHKPKAQPATPAPTPSQYVGPVPANMGMDAPPPAATLSPPPEAAPASPPPGAAAADAAFLSGSSESVAQSVQAYEGLVDMMIARSSDRAVGLQVFSTVLSPDATLAAPKFLPCGAKPLAVVLDINESGDAGQTGRLIATPGLMQAARAAKESNVTLIFNSERPASEAAATEAALNGAGLGPVAHLRTLWMRGDVGSGPGKDQWRWAMAQKYCVIAMVGNQLRDFSDLFDAPTMTADKRREAINGKGIATIWGHGWFILPNPVYEPGASKP